MSRIHTLNLATANRLLKIFEEPPAGYHFLLYTHNEDVVLPTIHSRSVVHRLASNQTSEHFHPLLHYFVNSTKAADPFEFEAMLKKEHLSDTQSFDLLNQLLNHYIKKLTNFCKTEKTLEACKERKSIEHIISFLTEKLKKPPQPGSSTLFWKMLFMTFPRF